MAASSSLLAFMCSRYGFSSWYLLYGLRKTLTFSEQKVESVTFLLNTASDEEVLVVTTLLLDVKDLLELPVSSVTGPKSSGHFSGFSMKCASLFATCEEVEAAEFLAIISISVPPPGAAVRGCSRPLRICKCTCCRFC